MIRIALANMFILIMLIPGVLYADDVETTVKSIAVIPFFMGRHPDSPAKTLTCPLKDLYYDKKEVKDKADEHLTKFVFDELLKRFDYRLLPLDSVDSIGVFKDADKSTSTIRSVAVYTGKALEVSHVLTGALWRYREREGGTMAVNNPASVAFKIYLIEVDNESVLWQGMYDETQKSLTENLFQAKTFFSQGAKWITVDELAKFGVEDIFKNFNIAPNSN